jgi:uncharacterized protein YdiU (UPF0061 family)
MIHTEEFTTRLDNLPFDNRFTRELPADPEGANYRRQVMQACYSRVQPAKVARPELVAYACEVAELLDLPGELVESDAFVNALAGNELLPGMDPYATCYGGHQFGNWAGQLGDGRAINLGEIVNRQGKRWALQLKGAGPTPYSRTADGLAVLRSSVREFLCSDAGPEPGADRRTGGPGYVLQRQPATGTGGYRLPGLALIYALRKFSDFCDA